MTILVTGGAGYIGSHTCVALLNAGYDITVVDNFSNSKPSSLKRVTEITGKEFRIHNVSLLDKVGLEKVFSDGEIDAVIHFAGLKSVCESLTMPLQYYYNNIMGTVVLCETMQKFGTR